MSATNKVNSTYYYKKMLISRIVCHSIAILALLLFFLVPCFTINEAESLGLHFSYLDELSIANQLFVTEPLEMDAANYAAALKTAWITLILFCLFLLALVEQIFHLIRNILSLGKLKVYLFRRSTLLEKENKKVTALKLFPSMFFFKGTVLCAALHWFVAFILPSFSTASSFPVLRFLVDHKPNFLFWVVLVLIVFGVGFTYLLSTHANKKATLFRLTELQTETAPEEAPAEKTEEAPSKPAPTTETNSEPATKQSSTAKESPVTVLDIDEEEEEEEEEEEYTVSYLDDEDENDLNSAEMPDDLHGYGKK